MSNREIRAHRKRQATKATLMIDAEGIVYYDDGGRSPRFKDLKPTEEPTIITLDFMQSIKKSVGIGWLDKKDGHLFLRARFWVEPKLIAEAYPAIGFALQHGKRRIWHKLFRIEPKVKVKSIGLALTSKNVDKRIRPLKITRYTTVKGDPNAAVAAPG